MSETKFADNRIDRLFTDATTANQYYDHLIKLGYENDDISVLMSKETKDKFYEGNPNIEKTEDAALKGAGAGSAIGGVVGAVVGAVAAVGSSMIIPGIGLVVAGPLVAAFAGAGAGAGGAGGAIIGALTNAGLSDDVSTTYVNHLNEGKIIISVEPKNKDHYITLSAYDGVIYKNDSYNW